MPTKTCALVITSSFVAQPCMIRAQRPTQLFGLVQKKGMTILAVPRSLRTSATSICHALIDAKIDHRATSLKIQGYLNLATVYRIHSMHRGETEQRRYDVGPL